MSNLDVLLYGNSIRNWMISLGIIILGTGIVFYFFRVVISKIISLSKHHQIKVEDFFSTVFKKTNPFLVLVFAIYASTFVLAIHPRLQHLIVDVSLVALFLQIGLWGSAALDFWLTLYVQYESQRDPGFAMTVNLLRFVGKAVLWIVLLLLTLENLGVNITALVAGLGIGGIAIALATQNIFGDLFASLSIVMDKPFVIGDNLGVDQYSGMVEHIGMKSTRLRSVSGEELIFANSDLLKSRIRNYGTMNERRVLLNLNVTYDTPPEQLAKIPSLVKEIIGNRERVRFERAHFAHYGDSALIFEVVYYVLSPDFELSMDINQAINFAIYERFLREKIEFAVPARNLYVVKPLD